MSIKEMSITVMKMRHGFICASLWGGLVLAMSFSSLSLASYNPLTNKQAVVKAEYFQAITGVAKPNTVDCTLKDGTQSQCLSFHSNALPNNVKIGPFCPENLHQEAGIWEWDGQDAGLYRLNGDFFKKLSALGYRFYDEKGDIYITTPGGAAPSTTKAEHACLEAKLDESVNTTTLIPIYPKQAKRVTDLGTVADVGLALDGIPVFADAPSVLTTGQLPALDECGGHVDPGGYYHWHATSTDINASFKHEGVQAHCHLHQSHSALFAFAFDGFPMYGSAEQDGHLAQHLDECRGHFGATKEFPEGVYHYHASLTFPNLPKCLRGVSAQQAFKTTAKTGKGSANAQTGPGQGPRAKPNFKLAASTLGVSEELLRQTLGSPPPNLSKAAKTLGVTVAQLQAALGKPI